MLFRAPASSERESEGKKISHLVLDRKYRVFHKQQLSGFSRLAFMLCVFLSESRHSCIFIRALTRLTEQTNPEILSNIVTEAKKKEKHYK